MKKKGKWKILGLSILGIFVLGIAALGYEYYQLQPKNHFSSVPVVGAKKTSTDQVKTPVFNVLLIGSDQRKGQKLGHTDSMMLIHVDLNKNKYQAVSIPRDT